ncbi:hypothetical protein Tco_0148231 [Tanacetum coccineum]
MLPNADLFEGMGQISSKSGGWDQFGSNIATALICISFGRVYNFSKLIFDGQEHAAQAPSHPTPTPPPIPTPTSPPPPPPETEPTTDENIYEE